MSILRDLDPTNTRLSALPPPRPGPAIVRFVALLLIAAGTVWLFLTQHPERKNGAIESLQTENPDREPRPRVVELVQRTPETTALPPEQSLSSKPDKGAALIRESSHAQENAIESNKGSLKIKQEANSGLKTEPPDKKELAVAPQQKPRGNRVSNSAAPKKQGKPVVTRAATDGNRSLTATKKSSERDIDIITAIVR